MKNISKIIYLATALSLSSCSNSPTDKAKRMVKAYLLENFKNPKNYEPLLFSSLDTLNKVDTSDSKQISLYKIIHYYTILNSEKDKATMTITFFLDKDLKVTKTDTKSINGDYGTLSGNAFWKYNDYVGNKADAGSEIALFTLDTLRSENNFETTADLLGNYQIEKILPGKYLLIVRSKNATDCPENQFSNLMSFRKEINLLFNFDINNYKTQLDEINKIDSIYSKNIDAFPSKGSLSQMTANIAKSEEIEKQRREKIEKLFELFPNNFKRRLKLYNAYSNATEFSTIRIEEGKNNHIVTDFGITCL